MTIARENALVIKGYLMANNAPVQLLVGIEHVINELAQTIPAAGRRAEQKAPEENISELAQSIVRASENAIPLSQKTYDTRASRKSS